MVATQQVTKKVGGASVQGTAPATPATGKRGRPPGEGKQKGRSIFNIAEAKVRDDSTGAIVSAVNEEGRLTAVPRTVMDQDGTTPLVEGWSPKKHKPIKRKQFASDDVFLDYRVTILDHQLESRKRLRDDLAKRADRLRKFGDEATRKKAAKLDRMKAQMAALEAELKAEGVEMSEV